MSKKALSAFALAVVFALTGAASAATPTAKKTTTAKPKAKPTAKAPARVKLPPLLREVEAKYSKAQTLTAEFEETNKSAALKQTKKSSGILKFKRPDKVRWETLKPDKNLLVGDGKKFYFYTPPFDETDNGQYMVKDQSQVQSKLAQVLLSGSFSSDAAMKAMKIEQLSHAEFVIVPRKGSGGTVNQAKIKIDPTNKLIVQVSLAHKGGNRTEIVLSKIELGQKLDDSLFNFTPPPNTEKVEN